MAWWALVAWVWVGGARAQGVAPFDAERLRLNPGAADSLVVESGRLLEPGALQLMALAHYERSPLTVQSGGEELGKILRYRLSVDLSAAYAVTDRLQLEAQVPILAAQRGDDLTALGIAKPASAGLGTPVVGARYGLLAQARGAPLDLSVGLGIGLPLGTVDAFGRADSLSGLTVLPGLSVGRAVGPLVVGGQVTGVLRGNAEVLDETLGSALDVAAMVATRGEGLRGELSVRSEIGFSSGAEVEVLGGGRLPVGGGLELFALGGPGLTRTAGTPSFRVLAGVGFRLPGHKAAPAQEVKPRPVTDSDQDGIPDGQDRCPREAGDAAHQGCPFHDRDHDTVADEVDNCPDEPGDPANQGCKVEQKVVLTEKKIEVKDSVSFSSNKVFFGTNRIELAADYKKMLDQIAEVLRNHPEISRVQIQGHTDNTGEPAYNLGLSEQRAEAVRSYLVQQGVAEGRLEAKGFGQTQPIASNDTPAGREQNRRVEFIILSRGEAPTAPERLQTPAQP